MVHGDTIADADSIKLEGHTALATNARLYRLGYTSQMNMPGHDLIEAIDHADKGLGEVAAADADGAEQSAMRSPLDTFFNAVATQCLQEMLSLFRNGGKYGRKSM